MAYFKESTSAGTGNGAMACYRHPNRQREIGFADIDTENATFGWRVSFHFELLLFGKHYTRGRQGGSSH